ncbi:DUF960 domain-containing protein [Levilactobacillus bambusae]|uniref:GTP cyclohydrolase n=1 Tax=Levilactobacillus bambusae TaxID=2024736 RepID=A0A2V1N1C3_9LACO|nr:DUF960 domain-containing protein [Levilactobacillus bambusae]PWG01091.1 GTP cyclohydrolase [Levilactobacillus bambusae]
MFDNHHARYASYGTVAVLPGEMIDTVWYLIDQDLQGMFPLENVLTFHLEAKDGKVAYRFQPTDLDDGIELSATFDTDFPYSGDLPDTILAYDDGESQIILLPAEARNASFF